MTTWMITGASRGFGQRLTAAALDAGDAVVGAARDPQRVLDAFPDAGDRLLAVELDVTQPEQAAAAVNAAVEAFDSIDIVVNNAGYGLFGSVEETSDADVRALFDTNVFGLLNVTRAVLPTLRAQGRGHIVNIGSSAGFLAGAGRGLYGATKFAVEAITEALYEEVGPLGVHATVVEAGSFRTEFLSPESRRTSDVAVDAYAETVGALQTALIDNNGHQPGDPNRFVTAIRELVALPDPPLRLQLGSDTIERVETKLATVAEGLDRWRDLALTTDFRD